MIKEGKSGMKESWSKCGLGDRHLSSHSGNWLLEVNDSRGEPSGFPKMIIISPKECFALDISLCRCLPELEG